MTPTEWADYLRGRKDRSAMQGHPFDASDLDPRFARFYSGRLYRGKGQRIKIRDVFDNVLTGTVGITTGWKPVFMLMRRSTDYGSSITLGPTDTILAVKRGRRYEAI